MIGRKKEEDLKSKRVVVHVTQKEKDIVQAIARRKGMDVSTYLRTICIYEQWDRMFGGQ